MNLLVTSDWQCSLQNLDRMTVFRKQLISIIQANNKAGKKTIFAHLGDVKENMNPVDQRVTNFIHETFIEIRDNGAGLLFNTGNHDRITTQDGVPSITPLIASLGATVADETWVKIPIRLLTWRANVVKYCIIYMVPYARDPVLQTRMFKEAAIDAVLPEYKDPSCQVFGRDNIKILFFHNTLTGCRQNLYTKGTGISIDDVSPNNYEICVGGHIHLPQKIKPNIYYVGSPFAQDWGEANMNHRLLQLTIDESRK